MEKQFDKDHPKCIVLAMDPSGNYSEGKGTTGYCLANDGFIYVAKQIAAAEYPTQMEYWDAVLMTIQRAKEEADSKHCPLYVVCEDYRLYASASQAQINSNLETPQLIGAIRYFCWESDIPLTMQMAAEVKTRWSDDVLRRKGWLHGGESYHEGRSFGNLRISGHALDAIRHCLHFCTFKLKSLNCRDERKERRAERYEQNYQRGSSSFYRGY